MSLPIPPAQSVPPSSSPDSLQWQRVHRATPFVRGWIVLVALVFVILQNAGQDIYEQGVDGTGILIIVGIFLAFGLLWIGYGWLAWRRMTYAIDYESVYLKSGVIFRQEKKVRLDRIQAVDIAKPLIARLVGLAELQITSAASSDFKLGFLTDSVAQQLRNEILARAAGVVSAKRAQQLPQPAPGPGGSLAGAPLGVTPFGAAPVGMPTIDGAAHGVPFGADSTAPVGAQYQQPLQAVPGVPEGAPYQPVAQQTFLSALAQEAPEQVVYSVPPGRTIGSAFLNSGTLIALMAIIGVAADALAGATDSIFMVLPLLFAVGPFVWQRFAGEFGFTAATSPDGVRVRQGLLETRSQTIPPGRVQAIRLTQPLLWRPFGWWRADLNIAGAGNSNSNDGQNLTGSILLPVGTVNQAIDALWLVLPDLGVDDPLGVLSAAMTGKGQDHGFTTSPRSAMWLDPWSWRRNGYRVLGRGLLIRKGYFTRRIELVPHERTQSLGLHQGPLQRRLGLTSFALHSTKGHIAPQVPHLSNADAATLLAQQTERADIARHGAGPERWMEQIDAR